MKVIEVEGAQDDLFISSVAVVETDGITRKVRLDIVDRLPEPGDYVIVHAGFAIHCLSREDALKSLRLLEDMAKHAPAGK